jgi:hypothetical protein
MMIAKKINNMNARVKGSSPFCSSEALLTLTAKAIWIGSVIDQRYYSEPGILKKHFSNLLYIIQQFANILSILFLF